MGGWEREVFLECEVIDEVRGEIGGEGIVISGDGIRVGVIRGFVKEGGCGG